MNPEFDSVSFKSEGGTVLRGGGRGGIMYRLSYSCCYEHGNADPGRLRLSDNAKDVAIVHYSCVLIRLYVCCHPLS